MVSVVACGNDAKPIAEEETVTLDEPLQENTKVDIEETVEEQVVEQTELVEAVNPEVTVVEETKIEKETPKVTNEEQAPAVKEEIKVKIVRAEHSAWNDLLIKYVSASGKVNYKGMKADISKIKTYLKQLENTPPKSDWSKNEKLAYWINLYNASTVYLIASNYPTKSITNLSGGKPWDKKFIKSGTKTYSLNDIEHNIVRPTFKDPRVHAALNCAAKSCPKLLNGAFLPHKLNAQLDKQTRAWINDKTKNQLNGNKAQVSQLFDWYKDDFKGGVVPFINKYISTSVALSPNAKITYLEYDWALNE